MAGGPKHTDKGGHRLGVGSVVVPVLTALSSMRGHVHEDEADDIGMFSVMPQPRSRGTKR